MEGTDEACGDYESTGMETRSLETTVNEENLLLLHAVIISE